MSLIDFKNVSFNYDKSSILRDMSLNVPLNSFRGVIGPNGSGKSTFLSLLCGQLKPQSGTISIDQKSVIYMNAAKRAQTISLVRQEFIPVFGFSVYQTVMMARFSRQKNMLFENQEDRQAVENALKATDTLEFSERPLSHLSGGERQRVFIARALAQETPILLLDEPTSHLDLKHQIQIFDLLKQMQQEQEKTIVIVTHDINLAGRYCDQILLLGPEGTFYDGTPEQVLESGQIQSVFGVCGYQGQIKNENIFVPLGQYSKERPE